MLWLSGRSLDLPWSLFFSTCSSRLFSITRGKIREQGKKFTDPRGEKREGLAGGSRSKQLTTLLGARCPSAGMRRRQELWAGESEDPYNDYIMWIKNAFRYVVHFCMALIVASFGLDKLWWGGKSREKREVSTWIARAEVESAWSQRGMRVEGTQQAVSSTLQACLSFLLRWNLYWKKRKTSHSSKFCHRLT